MKYFFDTEFHEYKKKPLFGKPINTIELISIGMVREDGEEYYAICSDFDIKAAWKNDWLKENVLTPIWRELMIKDNHPNALMPETLDYLEMTYSHLKKLIKKYGKPSSQIRFDILIFTLDKDGEQQTAFDDYVDYLKFLQYSFNPEEKPEFYAFFADYDWVVFCWLFGRMIELPEAFPFYCRDLKQMMDELLEDINKTRSQIRESHADKNINDDWHHPLTLMDFKDNTNFPQQDNEHNALDDAKWNLKLYNYLKTY